MIIAFLLPPPVEFKLFEDKIFILQSLYSTTDKPRPGT